MPQLRYCPCYWLLLEINLEDDHTPSGPTLGGPNTGSTVAGALLGSPGENVAKEGTILPLPLSERIF